MLFGDVRLVLQQIQRLIANAKYQRRFQTMHFAVGG
jgi:hypothetical protein